MRPSPSKEIWGEIELALYKSKVTKKELSRLTGVHANTISRDAKEPDRIPLGRLCLYLSVLGLQNDEILKSLGAVALQ
ncbi:MAG: helix-turn-helix domain-containing protein [Oscillospiraceae bacterium]|nr:helix-turn-helix domain-containing protein [Oscillospiraceae bacterium]